MISCVLIDCAVHEDRALENFNSFCGFLGEHLQDFSCFDKIYFATHTKIDRDYRVKGIAYMPMPQLSYEEYQLLSVFKLYDMFTEDFVVSCQLDGFPLYPENWKEEFLEYDYIGAPWSPVNLKAHLDNYYNVGDDEIDLETVPNRYLVGNSGFCLRSRKFLEVSSKSTYPLHVCPVHFNHFTTAPKFDDFFFCVGARSYFDIRGINFAPVDVASRFSLEAVSEEATRYTARKEGFMMQHLPIGECIDQRLSFGYHGRPALNHILGIKK